MREMLILGSSDIWSDGVLKRRRDTAGKHAFRLEAEAVIALGFVSATLCLLMFLSSFTQQLFCVHLLKVQNPII